MNIKHILFDNDGTVVDSEIIAVRTMLRMLNSLGLPIGEYEYSKRFPGLREREIVTILREEYSMILPGDFWPRVRAEHRRLFESELQVIPGMDVLFRAIRTTKSMVSNGSVQHVELCLRQVNLLDALDGQIFSAEHVERPKPYPDVYEYALEKLELKPENVVVVEDSPAGVQAAKGAGLTVVGLLAAAHIQDGHGETLLRQGADFIATDTDGLKKIFRQINVF
ncbi:MAG: HAD-IA family hydrolase [Thermoanaerobaculia bacterium]|nr:HAD-IA family hydrolase [Thermoanaerobaculia bacterium]